MASRLNILIVGAGIAGLSAALSLRLKGHEVTVIEKNPRLTTLGGRIAIDVQAVRVLNELGVAQKVEDTLGNRQDRILSHRRWNGELIVDVQWGKDGRDTYGFSSITGRRSDFQKVLYDESVKNGVQIRFNCPVTGLNPDRPSATLQDGEVLEADIIVAGDGIRSSVRSTLFPGNHETYSGLDDYLADVPIAVLKNDPLLRELEKGATFWWGHNGCVVAAAGGTPENEQYFMEFVHFRDPVTEGSSQKLPLGDLVEFFKGWDPKLEKLLQHVKDAHIWRLTSLSSDLSWVSESGKVVLIGDASHAMLPHTGSGATTAVEDGYALAECLSRATSLSSVPDCLRAFETIRKPRLKYVQEFGLEQSKSMHIPDGPEQRERDEWMKKVLPKPPPAWDGKMIDEPPWGKPEMRRAYLAGYNTKDHTNRLLDKILDSKV